MTFVDERLESFNERVDYVEFSNVVELQEFIQKHGIVDRQRFWFTVGNAGTLFECVFEYFYEG